MSCQTRCPFNNIIECKNDKCQTECLHPLKDPNKCSHCIETKCKEFGPLQNCWECGIINDPNLDSNFCKDSTSKEVCEDLNAFNCCKWVEDNKLSTGSIIGIIFGSLVTIGLLVVIIYYSMNKHKRKK